MVRVVGSELASLSPGPRTLSPLGRTQPSAFHGQPPLPIEPVQAELAEAALLRNGRILEPTDGLQTKPRHDGPVTAVSGPA